MVALCALSAAAACGADLDIPPAAKVTCETAGCPPGLVCRPEVGYCVRVDDLDTEAPRLVGEPGLPAEPVGAGADVEVTLTASEPLATDPVVTVADRPFVVRSQDDLTWTLGYTTAGDEPEGETPVTATLVDAVGNTAEGLACGTVTFDFTPPRVVPGTVSITPGVAGRAGTVRIALSLDEPPSEVAVSVGGLPATRVEEEGGTAAAPVFEYSVTGEEPEGETAALARLVDEAGNARSDVVLGRVTFDRTPPTIEAQELPPARMRPGQVLLVGLTYSEPPDPTHEVVLVGEEEEVVLDRVAVSAVELSYLHTVKAEDDGERKLELRGLADAAGNGASTRQLGEVVVDAVPPDLVEGTLSLTTEEFVQPDAQVRVEFVTTEPVDEPDVALELATGDRLPLTAEEPMPVGEGTRYGYALTVDAAHPEVAGRVVVALRDAVGNRGGPWSVGPVTLDRTPPRLRPEDVVVTPTVKIDGLLEVVATADEPLRDATLRLVPDDLDLGEVLLSRGEARWSRPVRAGDQSGRYGLVLSVFDRALNETRLRLPSQVLVDAEAPGVVEGSVRVEPRLRAHGGRVTIVFDTHEPLDAPPEVEIGGVGSVPLPGCTPTHFEYEHTVDRRVDAEGTRPVVATLRDPAGNTATVPLDRVTWDLTPPALTGQPEFERCDGRALAHEAGNDVWLGRPDCPEGVPALVVYFTVSETPPAAPRVTVAGRALSLLDDRSAPPFFVAAYEPSGDEPLSSPASPAPAGQPVVAETEDEAGNKARLTLGTLRFDYEPPDPVWDEAARSRVRYVRDPWGSDGTGYEPRMRLEVDGAAFEERGEVRVWAVTDRAAAGTDPVGLHYSRGELGSGVFVPGMDLTVEAGTVDNPVVWVTLMDPAGNESDADPQRRGTQALPVSAVEWVGTLNRKQAGDTVSNPHELRYGYTRSGETQLALDVESWPVDWQAPYSGAATLGGQAPRLDARRSPWQDANGLTHIDSRLEPGLAWDGIRSRLVLFGGLVDDLQEVSVADTWEFDGRRLVRRSPLTSPPPLDTPFLFPEPHGGVLLVGDCGEEIWRWDGHDWRRLPVGATPPGRRGCGVAYDTARGVIVLFGGTEADETCTPGRQTEALGVRCGDTWEWAGGDWVQQPTATHPEPRARPGMTFDPLRQVVVLFGGRFTFEQGDTWLWDGERWSRRWVDPDPPGRYQPSMAFDHARGVVTMDGGAYHHGFPRGDTWDWDGARWARRPVDAPVDRTQGALAWDAGRSRLVAGEGFCWDVDDWWDRVSLWDLHDETWTRATSFLEPQRAAPAAAYDEAREEVVLFGGVTLVWPTGALRDTWTWDGSRWTRRTPEGPIPAARSWGALAWEPVSGRVVLFGGCSEGNHWADCGSVLDDTWEWDGAGWQRAAPADRPPARFGHALATAPGGEGVLLFGGAGGGGEVLGDTSFWDGARWQTLAPEHAPPARLHHGMVWDEARDVVLLYGGTATSGWALDREDETALSDTWEWDGVDWREVSPATAPTAQRGDRLVYDAARARAVLFDSAFGPDGRHPTVWEWDGLDWTEQEPAVSPPERLRSTLVYHGGLGQTLMAGGGWNCGAGEISPRCFGDWSHEPGRARPHLVASFDLRAANTLEPSGRDPSGRTLLETTVRTRAGGLGHGRGTGRADGAPQPGYTVAVSAFGHAGWVPLHESAEGTPTEPADWSHTYDRAWRCGEAWCESADITRWGDAAGRLHLDVGARSVRGASEDDGGVALDYVELRLSYWRTGCETSSERLPEGTPDGTPCSDGLPETEGETCQGGACRAP